MLEDASLVAGPCYPAFNLFFYEFTNLAKTITTEILKVVYDVIVSVFFSAAVCYCFCISFGRCSI